MSIVQRIAAGQATNEDYGQVSRLLAREVIPHARMYRRLACRPIDSDEPLTGVPDLTSADDATLWLRDEPYGDLSAHHLVICGKRQWLVSYGDDTGVTSETLGAAMWAAWYQWRVLS